MYFVLIQEQETQQNSAVTPHDVNIKWFQMLQNFFFLCGDKGAVIILGTPIFIQFASSLAIVDESFFVLVMRIKLRL